MNVSFHKLKPAALWLSFLLLAVTALRMVPSQATYSGAFTYNVPYTWMVNGVAVTIPAGTSFDSLHTDLLSYLYLVEGSNNVYYYPTVGSGLLTPFAVGPPTGSTVYHSVTTITPQNFTYFTSQGISDNASTDGNYWFNGFPTGTNVNFYDPGSILLSSIMLTSSSQSNSISPPVGSLIVIMVSNQASPSPYTSNTGLAYQVMLPYFDAVGGPSIFFTIVEFIIMGGLYARTKSLGLLTIVAIIFSPIVGYLIAPEVRGIYAIIVAAGVGFILYRIVKRTEVY